MSNDNELAIPRAILDRYHQCYQNSTYLAIRHKVEEISRSNPARGGLDWELLIMNLVIDASYDRLGATFYAGAEQHLMQLIGDQAPSLVTLCQIHLAHFGETAPADPQAQVDEVREQVGKGREILEEALRQASDIASWRGVTAYHWLNTVVFLLHAISVLLVESHYDSYTAEKLDRAVEHLRYGVQEATKHHFQIASDFLAWMLQSPRARG